MRLMMILILLLKLLSLLMLQQLLLPLHVIWMMHFPTAVCYMHAAFLLAPIVPAANADLLCTSHDAMLRPCFRWPAADWPKHPNNWLVQPWLHVCGRLMQPGLSPVHKLGVTALLPLPCHRLTLLRVIVLLVVLQVVVAMQIGLGSMSLLWSGGDRPGKGQGKVGGWGRLLWWSWYGVALNGGANHGNRWGGRGGWGSWGRLAPTADMVFYWDDGFVVLGFPVYVLDLYHLEKRQKEQKH